MRKKILHIACLDKFIPEFIHILRLHFDEKLHTVITYGDIKKNPHIKSQKTLNFSTLLSFSSILKLVVALHRNDKVILHGLFSPLLVILLCLMPWLHKKCYWTIWGGDLYYHILASKNMRYHILEVFRKFLISRLGGFITYVHGDYYNAQQWYHASGKLYECIMYKSNIYSSEVLAEERLNQRDGFDSIKINIQIGNSADPTNNHKQVFERLTKLDVQNQVGRIYCPLSYGNPVYAAEIKLLGEAMFGDKFYPLMDFMSLEQYNQILDEVDIAIFAHNRQQAMGNTINLLGRGKTVYMRGDTSSYALLTNLGIKVYSLDDISLNVLPREVAIANNQLVSNYFSEENLVKQLKIIFA
ncbi:TDP-N-acetylfucosamine:lipid II N-acetylfucosaminyltransferase [Shewanella chilikensis]|uniref:TDP-N-acetylfucosamine:lipid II N-acetylfucosaminyltransferase n=1 Tax=Shewanella chilikensis TaxID=558541 RepID=UPI003A97F161